MIQVAGLRWQLLRCKLDCSSGKFYCNFSTCTYVEIFNLLAVRCCPHQLLDTIPALLATCPTLAPEDKFNWKQRALLDYGPWYGLILHWLELS